MTEQLQSLIERLESAEGPDREIDAHMFCLHHNGRFERFYKCGNEEWCDYTDHLDEECCTIPDRYTASLDAAVALVEKVLPDWQWGRDQTGFTFLCQRNWPDESQPIMCGSECPSVPLALLTAMVKALIAEEEK